MAFFGAFLLLVECGKQLYRFIRPQLPDWGHISDIIKCPVCHDISFRQKTLYYGHSVCEDCLQRLSITSNELSCPVCRRSHRLPESGIVGIPVNFAQADVQAMVLEEQGLPPMERSIVRNEVAVGDTMPYNFCILSDANNNAISGAVETILDQLEREQINGNFVQGYWHERDDHGGKTMLQNIAESIENSKFVLLLIHPDNIRSKWWTRNRYMSLTHRLNSSRPDLLDTVIPVIVDDPDAPLLETQDIPLDLQVLHRLRYDSNPRADFWRKLKRVVLGREEEINIINELSCPVCRRSHRLPESGIVGIPVNFAQADVQAMVLEEQGLPPMERSIVRNEVAVGDTMPYNFCILSDANNNAISGAVETILDQLEREQINGNFVQGYWHERDDHGGKTMLQNIAESIENSKFVLLLIHPDNIRSKWWTRNRYMSLTHRLNSSRPDLLDTVIPVIVDDPDAPLLETQDIPLDLQVLHRLRYDSNPRADFWRKLKRVVLGREEEINIM